MWSLGVTMYESAMLKLPFGGSNDIEYKRNVLNKDIEIPEVSDDFPLIKFLVQNLLI